MLPETELGGVGPPRGGVLMIKRKRFAALFVVVAVNAVIAAPARAQNTLYNNGPDGNVGYYRVNFGAVTTNSFALPNAARVTGVTLTLYSVDDGNPPLHLKWTITTEALGGRVMGEGRVNLTLLGGPYPTRFQLFAWEMGFAIPSLSLPAGTYYLQVQDAVTRWDTYSFWAQSGEGLSQAYYEPIGANGAGDVSQVSSESFSVLGEWSTGAGSVR